MTDPDLHPSIACPNCRQPMQAQDLEQNYHGAVRVDLCFSCGGIWFDHLGSIQLAPSGVVELFKEIQAHMKDSRLPVAARLVCPRCEDDLAPGSDLSKAGRFSYFRCLRGDGRFTPFIQFLREKQFIRTLSAVEIERVRSQVRQIQCSECGAPIDLEHDTQCKFCHAPVSFLDPDAVQKAVQLYSDAENRRKAGPTPEALGDAIMRVHAPQAAPAPMDANHLSRILAFTNPGPAAGGTSLGLDLVAAGIRAIGYLFER